MKLVSIFMNTKSHFISFHGRKLGILSSVGIEMKTSGKNF